MKKNILAIIILAATIVNITLSAIMLFTVVPKAQRTDELMKKIVSIINLELEDPDAKDYAEVPFADRETYSVSSVTTVNLARTADDKKNHYAQAHITLVINKKAKGYSTIQPALASYESIIKSIVSEEVGKYTVETLAEGKKFIEERVLSRLNSEFQSTEFLIGVDIFMNYE